MVDVKAILKELNQKTISPEMAISKLGNIEDGDKAKSEKRQSHTQIAVVGISGKYPMIDSMDEYWKVLSEGNSVIREIPKERWNTDEYYQQYPGSDGKIYSRWMGMMDHVDEFDSLYFEIPPTEAAVMDPQHRLFIQEGYKAFQDAGYNRHNLNGINCGVYLGIVNGDYGLLSEGDKDVISATGTSNAIGSARLSYYLNLKGPALAMDTACSSSLVAAHIAIQALKSSEIDMALVGGSCLYLSPQSYISMCMVGMLSPDGKCKTFDNDANGFVPGEGVGAVVLKRLDDAKRDGNQIYGVITASGINQDGKTNGITAPNLARQEELIKEVYKREGIDPEQISYAELHGTGTKLGDPVELEALKEAFEASTSRKRYCAIGSVKSNMGHTSAAAGMAGLQKILLCMKNKTLVPTINVETPNEHFDFEASPFYINRETVAWERPQGYKRQACLSSFGFSGTNAHLVVEEYEEDKTEETDNTDSAPGILILSARDKEQLKEYAVLLKDFLEHEKVNLQDFLYTMQVSRDMLKVRLVIVAVSKNDFVNGLVKFIEGDISASGLIYTDNAKSIGWQAIQCERRSYTIPELQDIGKIWAEGKNIDWRSMYDKKQMNLVSVPAYPFKRAKYWIRPVQKESQAVPLTKVKLSGDCAEYCITMNKREFYVADHNVLGDNLVPGAATISEIIKGSKQFMSVPVIIIKDLVWHNSVKVSESCNLLIDYQPLHRENEYRFDMREIADGQQKTVASGTLVGTIGDDKENYVDIAAVKKRCQKCEPTAYMYAKLNNKGLKYGPSFRTLNDVYCNEQEVLGTLKNKIPLTDELYLNPGMLDGAFQTISYLFHETEGKVYVPFSIDSVEIRAAIPDVCYVHTSIIRSSTDKVTQQELKIFDIKIVDSCGAILLKINGFFPKPLREPGSPKSLESEKEEIFYGRQVFRRTPNLTNEGPKSSSGKTPLLIFDTNMELYNVMQSFSKRILVLPGREFERHNNIFYIDRANMEHYFRLFKELEAQGTFPQKVICNVNLSLPIKEDITEKKDFYTVVGLSKVLLMMKPKKIVKLVYTNMEAGEGRDCSRRALSALFKTIHQENPCLAYTLLTATGKYGSEDMVKWLLMELTNDTWQSHVLYDNGIRTVEQLCAIESPKLMKSAIRNGGVYVITGGLGGLGRIFSQYISSYKNTKLYLIGRKEVNELSSEELSFIRRLRSDGTSVEYQGTDVTKQIAVKDLFLHVRSTYGAINGIIHSAGNVHDNLLLTKDFENLETVLGPKVNGTLLLDEETSEDHLDWFVVFSSLAAVMGNVGQADYCYGNCFMDIYMEERERLRTMGKRSGQSLSICWPLWQSGGMKIDGNTQKWMEKETGLKPISEDEGVRAFEFGLNQKTTQLTVMKGETKRIHQMLSEGNSTREGEKTVGIIKKEDGSTTITILKEILEKNLGIEKGDMDIRDSFEDYGIDSILVVRIIRDLEEIFGELPKTLFYEYETIIELADYLNDYTDRRSNDLDRNSEVPERSTDTQASDDSEVALRVIVDAFIDILTIERSDIDIEDNFDAFGLDSIIAIRLIRHLEDELGELPKTLFYEYDSIKQLSEYLMSNKTAEIKALSASVKGYDKVETIIGTGSDKKETVITEPDETPVNTRRDDIAIVGLSGHYPMADNVEELWQNLIAGKDCITEIPEDRWEADAYFNPDKNNTGTSYSKWGGFVDGVDQFDPLFFHISPADADFMDPQARLFMEATWEAMEDGGYTRKLLKNNTVGVYVGVMYGMYQLYNGQYKDTVLPAKACYAEIANRISYFCDFNGPSMAVDTMCASSLTAIHLACESIKHGECQVAFAGGINLTLHPNKYLIMSQGKFASSDGRCRSFGEGGDGYVPGEGYGVVMLKSYDQAIADHDQIYGVVKGSAVNAGGRTSGFTVPNPKAQSEIISTALKKAGMTADQLDYVEAHGTGTALGDPIEIAALKKAFEETTNKKQYCAIGSIKSNIGHLEGASGIAGLTKGLLQMKYEALAPSIHSTPLNPFIKFTDSPFYVQQELCRWERKQEFVNGRSVDIPRRFAVSSFGAGGANAHIIIEEHVEQPVSEGIVNNQKSQLYLFSAQNKERLAECLSRMTAFLDEVIMEQKPLSETAVAYMLQTGREHFEERIAFIATSLSELKEQLDSYLTQGHCRNNTKQGNILDYGIKHAVMADAQLHHLYDEEKLEEIAAEWIQGKKISWDILYESSPQKISLPTYPFARERHWVIEPEIKMTSEKLHPLVHTNESNISELRFESIFTGAEFFLADHIIDGKSVLPGVVYLEMARYALKRVNSQNKTIKIRNVLWKTPAIKSNSHMKLYTSLIPVDANACEFIIYSEFEAEQVTHCEGEVYYEDETITFDFQVKEYLANQDLHEINSEQIYELFRGMDVQYGAAHQCIHKLYLGNEAVLGELTLPQRLKADLNQYCLHPSLMDAALQTAIGLSLHHKSGNAVAEVPFMVKETIVHKRCTEQMWVRVSLAEKNNNTGKKDINVAIYDNRGELCVELNQIIFRAPHFHDELTKLDDTVNTADDLLVYTPEWEIFNEPLNISKSQQHHIIITIQSHEEAVKAIKEHLPKAHVYSLLSEENCTADQYLDLGQQLLICLQNIFKEVNLKRTLLQLIIDESVLYDYMGLAQMIMVAQLERPNIDWHLLGIGYQMSEEQINSCIIKALTLPRNQAFCFRGDNIYTLKEKEVAVSNPGEEKQVWKDNGCYLITGGSGALGLAIANQINKNISNGIIVLLGNSKTESEVLRKIHKTANDNTYLYRTIDITDLEQVKKLIDSIQENYKSINGIFHCAGVVKDFFILNKNIEDFKSVLLPKVIGTYNLDLATRGLRLDFLYLFSSLASIKGNIGQCDYAVANGYMNYFALKRNILVSKGECYGTTSSICWPLWKDGGMKLKPEIQASIYLSTGIGTLDLKAGMSIFSFCKESDLSIVIPLQGDKEKIRTYMEYREPDEVADTMHKVAIKRSEDGGQMKEQLINKLKNVLAKELNMSAAKLDARQPLEKYGINSVLIMQITVSLEKEFGRLPKTLFFEYQSINELADFFICEFPNQAEEWVGYHPQQPPKLETVKAHKENNMTVSENWMLGHNKVDNIDKIDANRSMGHDIAIIGLAGQYPQADSLDEFWENLQQGKDCIEEIPKVRWDYQKYYSADRTAAGKTYGKWGGFLNDVDTFDPQFFNISPVEAEIMDPQERLFLQCVYHTVEDAGYNYKTMGTPTKEGLRNTIGVYVGVMYEEYQLYGAQSQAMGNPLALNGFEASISNRVSYHLGFNGPSIALDTMCSSSLTAVHLACKSLLSGESEMAIAGGVNISIHPNKFLLLGQGRFLSSQGKCMTFGEGGDGYVPGEGVGAVLLKPLQAAKRDHDHIYGVIKGSAINHGGKVNGYSVPNPKAQAGAVANAVRESGYMASEISYIEAHGTGTALGDPIEISALNKVFNDVENQSCYIASVKSNIGHAESAAGIAGITKVLLQMKYKKIVPSLHSRKLNGNIDFTETPFIVPQKLCDWDTFTKNVNGQEKMIPRIAGVSGFGAGGANGHVIIEEYQVEPDDNRHTVENVMMVFSARNLEQLKQLILEMVQWLQKEEPMDIDLRNIAYTLQVGRAHHEVRVGFVVNSIVELQEKLNEYLSGEGVFFEGNTEVKNTIISVFDEDESFSEIIQKWFEVGLYEKILRVWSGGVNLEWDNFYNEQDMPWRMSLPTYPFARESYWPPVQSIAQNEVVEHIYPLLQKNTSTFEVQKYSNVFRQEEHLLNDHVVNGMSILPAVSFIEMSCEALSNSMNVKLFTDKRHMLRLSNLIWIRPMIPNSPKGIQMDITLIPESDGDVKLAAIDSDTEASAVYCEALSRFTQIDEVPVVDLERYWEEKTNASLNHGDIYQSFSEMGIEYGESYRGLENLYIKETAVLAKIVPPDSLSEGYEEFILGICMMDSALQAAVGMLNMKTDDDIGSPKLPFLIKNVEIYSKPTFSSWAVVEPGSESTKGGNHYLTISICDDDGNVSIRFKDILFKSLKESNISTGHQEMKDNEKLMYTTGWVRHDLTDGRDQDFDKRFILPIGYNQTEIASLKKGLSGSKIIPIEAMADYNFLEVAVDVYRAIKRVMQECSLKRIFLQIVFPISEGEILFALAGYLKTARIENPHFSGQIMGIKGHSLAETVDIIETNSHSSALEVRYDGETRYVKEIAPVNLSKMDTGKPWKDGGTYLITGGLGGLGRVITREIVTSVKKANIILASRSKLKEEGQKFIQSCGDRCTIKYVQADLSKANEVNNLCGDIITRYGSINGVIHCAGFIKDDFILKKSSVDVEQTLTPKVNGTLYLDMATKDIPLDFFILFSSLTSVTGNAGQSDYAVANAFMDEFARERMSNVLNGSRYGKTLVINWPYWYDGGMVLDEKIIENMISRTGIVPLREPEGLWMLYHALGVDKVQLIPLMGNRIKIEMMLTEGSNQDNQNYDEPEQPVININSGQNDLNEVEDRIKEVFAAVLKMPKDKLKDEVVFERYGIDSILIMKITEELEKLFGALPKTLLFEYQNLKHLYRYFAEKKVISAINKVANKTVTVLKQQTNQISKAVPSLINRFIKTAAAGSKDAPEQETTEDIAIIGMAGRFPGAENYNELWQRLESGDDCITEIPDDRWDYRKYYQEQKDIPGTSYSKWGGFLKDVDCFDPLFFHISPQDAVIMDPQERVFLQTAFSAIEDAGYTKESLGYGPGENCQRNVGVFVGVMNEDYPLYAAEQNMSGNNIVLTGNPSSIANRVSYCGDFHGPSWAVDTMCSSSLVAIHQACQAIKNGECQYALAGGVNLILHPSKYVTLSQAHFLSSNGRCMSFGEGGDGYTPGEGSGAILLKTKSQAILDGDHIYGVIKGSAVNHGGKTNGFTVPNPIAQAEVIKRALVEAHKMPEDVTYLEAHGTGTQLGDPIEISALNMVYGNHSTKGQYCAIGSIKSNIGHCESAAGIAAVEKVLLQMKYKRIVRSLHSEVPNRNIDFEHSCFYVPQEESEWEVAEDDQQRPRVAGISSFGAGGTNAHLIVEEYIPLPDERKAPVPDQIYVFSAKNKRDLLENMKNYSLYLKSYGLEISHTITDVNMVEAETAALLGHLLDLPLQTIQEIEGLHELGLDEYNHARIAEELAKVFQVEVQVSDLLNHYTLKRIAEFIFSKLVKESGEMPLSRDSISEMDLAYTLQVGREEMAERCAIVAANMEDLLKRMDYFCDGNETGDGIFSGNIFNEKNIDQTCESEGSLIEAARNWVRGDKIDWKLMHNHIRPKRIPLPTYVYEKRSFWFKEYKDCESTVSVKLFDDSRVHSNNEITAGVESGKVREQSTKEAILEYLCDTFSIIFDVPLEDINTRMDFEHYGINSINITRLYKVFEQDFGKVPSTLLFTYKNLDALAEYFLNKKSIEVDQHFSNRYNVLPEENVVERRSAPEQGVRESENKMQQHDIAIIGISGRYPMAENLNEFYRNLREGKDCIQEIPNERWDRLKYPQIQCKWGGFIKDAECFDPQFFNISPNNAAFMDPQERIFVEEVWKCLEDAGYTPEGLEDKQAGDYRGNVSVFAGITFNEYGHYGAVDIDKGELMPVNSQIYSIANRISYLLNLRGESLSVDTACSSSLYAIHLGCENIRVGKSELAIAGGVNLSLYPGKYITLNGAGFLAADGHCRSFGEGGSGYVPGEGVGVILLKSLTKAEADGDHIYGVIKGSAVNHGGKTHGYSVPNPVAQAEVIKEALAKANVIPESITYVEGHGTGTALGDPIEVEALNEAFGETKEKQYCSLGSVKGNIGHLEAAAGISQLTKVLLQMKYKELVPTRLNSGKVNSNIDLTETPFHLQISASEWKNRVGTDGKVYPRRAGISSFGVGGVNVHMIVEEYSHRGESTYTNKDVRARFIIPLSANTKPALYRRASDLFEFLRKNEEINMTEVAYTLQAGRKHMNYRMATIAENSGQLLNHLEAFLNGGDNSCFTGKVDAQQIKENISGVNDSIQMETDDALIRMAADWVIGGIIDFSRFYPNGRPAKIPLPVYSFEKEKYWLYKKTDTVVLSGTDINMPKGKIENSINQENTILSLIDNAPKREHLNIITECIQQKLAKLMGYPDDKLPDVDQGFFELGLESVEVLKAQSLLAETFETELDDQLFFNYANIREVSKYIESLLTMKDTGEREEKDNNSAAKFDEDGDILYLTSDWLKAPIQVDKYENVLKGDILLITLGEELEETQMISEHLITNEGRVVHLSSGVNKNTHNSDVFKADFCDVVALGQLIDSLIDDDFELKQVVLYLGKGQEASLAERIDIILHSVFNICKTLILRKNSEKLNLFCLYEVQETELSIFDSAVGGFLKAVSLENPWFISKTIGLEHWNFSNITNLLLVERNEVSSVNEIKYDGAIRYVKALNELPETQSEGKFHQSLKDNGVYLITGGLGGLGLIFTQYICSQVRANIVLAGRREMTGQDQEKLAGLNQSGSEVQYMRADITHKNETAELIAAIKTRYGQIDGVIHSAGIISDSMLRNKSYQDAQKVVACKVLGTACLDKQLQDETLDFFVMFSSLAAVLGNVGQSDYCLANSYLDQFATLRQHLVDSGQRYGRTITINWSFWASGGMSIDLQTKKWMKNKMSMELLTEQDGIQAIEKAFALNTPQVILIKGDERKIKGMLGLVQENMGNSGNQSADNQEKGGVDSKQDYSNLTVDELIAALEDEYNALQQ